MILTYALISVFIVSLISLVGVTFLVMKRDALSRLMTYLLALSSGVLLGSAFLDLLHEGLELLPESALLWVLVGIVFFFAVEKLMHWHHHVEGDHHGEEKAVGYLTLVGDGIHNFVDGVIIGAAYLTSLPLGITATIAVIAHEVPHELADFTILIHGGFETKKALALNFLSALTAVAGTLAVFFFATYSDVLVSHLIPFAAGNFIYIAASDLIPELHKKRSRVTSVMQIVLLIVGIYLVTLMPHE